jgi:uncharacterized damage-inducible protein DinB
MEKQPQQATFEYMYRAVHTEDGWIHPLKDVVKDVEADEAKWKPAAEVASIWEVVAHTTPYLYDVLRALRGEEKVKHEDWHALSDTSDSAWKKLRTELISGIERLGEEIAELKEADYSVAPPKRETPRWELLVDLHVHDAYHAGQLVKLRQLYAAQVGAKEVAGV